MTSAIRHWPRYLRRLLLLLLAGIMATLALNADLRNKAGCLLLIKGVAAASCVVPMPYRLPDDLAEQEAFVLGYQAYVLGAVYARSQILMEKDTNPGAPLHAPLNQFNVYPGLATPGAAIDFTPNNDTVYGLAWLDLSQGPVLLTIPQVPQRYWTVQATDWALNTFSYIGKRVHSLAGTYAYVPPGWQGELPAGVARIESPTNGVFLQARTVVQPEVEADIAPVVAQLKTYHLQPLDPQAKYPLITPGTPVPNPKLNNPLWQSLEFYSLLNRAWTFGGVRAQDRPLLAQFAPLGIGPGLTFDPQALSEAQRRGLQRAAEVAFERVMLHGQENGRMRSGWRFANNLGRYDENRLLASAIGLMGYGANIADEALYLPAFYDHEDQPLVSNRRYRIHFAADQLPPVNEFWSVTLYSIPENQLKANPINRYAIGDRTPGLQRNADGSIDIWVQQERPQDPTANWLPSGDTGQIWMVLRLYGPQSAALTGTYAPPPVQRLDD